MQFKHSILIIITCFMIIAACKTQKIPSDISFTATKKEQSLERGKNLAFNICGGCHYDKETKRFTGKQMKDIPKIAGKVFTSNLTHSKKSGVMHLYSDAALAYLLKTGYGHDGRFIPYMLRPNLADDDINDLLVYLRSDDPALAADDRIAGKTKLSVFGKLGMRIFIKPQAFRSGIPRPDEAKPVEYGKYLVDNIGCYHCHSAKATSINYQYPEKTKGYMAGGAKSKNKNGTIRGSNLTFDKETGIGDYTKGEFRVAVQQSIDRHGVKLMPPMHPFPVITDAQADAIYAYLKTLPPKRNNVK